MKKGDFMIFTRYMFCGNIQLFKLTKEVMIMSKIMRVILIGICCFILCACGDDNEHIGEAKTPSGSDTMKGQDYQSVVDVFEEKGFTNIKLEKIDDLVFGWLTKDGEVEEVSVGGDVEYSPDKWVPCDIEVVIKYHTFPEEETDDSDKDNIEQDKNNTEEQENQADIVLTVDNCQELQAILSNKAEIDESYSNFAEKYKKRTIEFNGRIDYVVNHGNYTTRFDILVSAGDYDANHQIGPTFKFEDVGASNLGLNTMYLEDEIKVGMNVKIVAEVVKFDSNSGLFFLEPVSVTKR